MVRQIIVADDHPLFREALKAAVGAPGVMTIHTEEASLAAIFIEMTGRGLEG